jgi:hypothetical protein
MKHLLCALLVVLSTFATSYGQAASVKITVHLGVELLTIVQKLASKDQPSTPTSYEREVLAYFAPTFTGTAPSL